MKKTIFVLIALGICSVCSAQYKYVKAQNLYLSGKLTEENCAFFERIPAGVMKDSRESLQWLASTSSGLYVRFHTNSMTIMARWSSKWDTHMNHMADVGCRGVDLYILDDGVWRYVASGRPEEKSPTEQWLIGGLKPVNHEFMMYLPLYEATTMLEIGVDDNPDTEIGGPLVNSPRIDRQIIMYGTSILQGGCASRPGMAYTNIISRKLDREVVNIGFSGNALLDPEVARFMAGAVDPAIFILDYCPNATADDIKEKGEAFYRVIRDAHPDVPVVFIDDVEYPACGYNEWLTKTVREKNAAQKALFNRLRKQGEKNIYHICDEHMIGTDNEATVDGTHFTDLGMMRYAEFLAPYIEKIIGK